MLYLLQWCHTHVLKAFHLRLFLTHDDVGFELGGGKDNKVYVPTEVKRELTLINQGIKVTEDTQKFRVAHLFNTIAADGSLLHSACKIRDDSFSTMRIFELDKSLTVWFLPLNKSHQDFLDSLSQLFNSTGIKKTRFSAGITNAGFT